MHSPDTPDRQLHSALVIGGTGFVGQHTVVELLDHGYDVTTL
ncbi:MAG: NAD-dependent epimerase/dehydratase family protein, partial [Halobacteriales archaeon]|nr:NAD-dependent epimerase/dehydratase family protein [Halobacteriales archaeon]